MRVLFVLSTLAYAGAAAVVRRTMSVGASGIVRHKAQRKEVLRSVEQENQHPQKWIYAIQTCAAEKYVRQLEGQLATWGSRVNKDDLLIVGGPYNNGEGKFACNETAAGQNCKEATVLYRGASKAEKVNADWLFHVIDDAYIFLPRVWKAMEALDPSEPVVYADFGCGRQWQFHAESEGGTKPKPTGWVEPEDSCDGVEKNGGICTGAGYIVSRGALKLLRRNFTLPSFVEHYTHISKGRASDLTSSCLFYDRNIKVKKWPAGHEMAQIRPNSKSYQGAGNLPDGTDSYEVNEITANPDYILAHLSFKNKSVIPSFMEHLHQSEEAKALEQTAQ